MKKISIVFPVYNEQDNLELLYQKVTSALAGLSVSYELIFVDNGSTDDSLNLIKRLQVSDSHIFFLSLSRNFGHQNALFAGLTFARGDAIITMDADLQHPPELLSKMIRLWQEGYEVVYTTKNQVDIPRLRYLFTKIFYWLISKISKIQLHFGQSDFRLLDRKVLDAILKMPEYHKFLRGQVEWLGFKQTGLSFDVQPRYLGESKFSYRDLLLFALDAIFSFSRYPLHVITVIGIIIGVLSCVYIAIDVAIPLIVNAFNPETPIPLPPGWATLSVAIFFWGSIQLIAIGTLGEYIGRVFDQTKGRPNFVIREASSFDEKRAS